MDEPVTSATTGSQVTGSAWLRRNSPWLLLVALSITLPELLTGSTPVFSLINPLALLGLLGLYGGGVVLIREASIVWRKGWGTILTLGVAYAIVEEGLATKTFFNTSPKVVGALSTYGHAWGVNWVWVSEMIVFHAIFSIALPILLTGMAFPERRQERFLERRGRILVLAAYAGTVAFMAVAFSPSAWPGVGLYGTTFLAAAVLVVIAYLLPQQLRPARPLGPARLGPRALFTLGLAFTFGFFGLCWIMVAVVPFPALVIGAIAVWTVGVGEFARRRLGNPVSRRGLAAFSAGLVTFLLVFSGFASGLGDFGAVLPLVLTATFLYLLYRDQRPDPSPAVSGAGAISAAPLS